MPLLERRPDTPQPLAEIVQKAMAKDPDARFASAAKMYVALYPFAKRSKALMDSSEGG